MRLLHLEPDYDGQHSANPLIYFVKTFPLEIKGVIYNNFAISAMFYGK